MSAPKLSSRTRRPSLILRDLLIVLFLIIFLITVAIAQLSSLGIYIVSMGYSSVTLGIKASVDNGNAAIVFTGATFSVYGDNVHLLNGTVNSFFPSQGSKSIDTIDFSVPYSDAGALLSSHLLGGGSIKYKFIGTATFYTPLGVANLPLNISTVTGLTSISPSSARLEETTAVTNDPSLASFTGATFRAYANGIDIVNGTARNSLLDANIPPQHSNVTTKLSVPYSNTGALLRSYFLSGGRANLSVDATAFFQTYITVSGEPIGEVGLALKASTMPASYGMVPAILDSVLIILAVVGIVLYRKGYA
ncbi:MAG: LEA type 2 family protein [Thaumarchaeota archaeon]|nr:LEA type 2 family protein [Nitrososphaerota archaeon]